MSAPTSTNNLLEIEQLSVCFGGLQALDGVNLSINEGEILGLIGPNGAGKTTLFNVITGLTAPSHGQLRWQGNSLAGKKPEQICRLGLARTFQNLRLFRELSCINNLQVAMGSNNRRAALELLALVQLQEKADAAAASLAYGDQRKLEFARALATKPKLLLLDEPAAGMNPIEKQDLQALVQRVRCQFKITILIIEHHVPLMMQLCDRLAVLNFGRCIALGSPEQVRRDPLVIEAYLGSQR
ncbi:ABC transporter ATP-binding protein [Synechococcus sp. UW140]|uniref:ABC transporter ATP-binding protein n=1 Tax=Synechococcus sp. UW140 TaxID=368503 RepID=UPI003137ED2B